MLFRNLDRLHASDIVVSQTTLFINVSYILYLLIFMVE